MNTRERLLAIVLGIVIIGGVIGGGVFGLYLPRLRAKENELMNTELQISLKQGAIEDLRAKKAQLDKWAQYSLPGGDTHVAWREYERYLNESLGKSGLGAGVINIRSKPPEDPKAATPNARVKKPAFTKLTYHLDGPANLPNLTKFLETFYDTPLLHRIRKMTITKPETPRTGARPDDLDISMEVEAIVLDGAKPRDKLIPEGVEKPQVVSKQLKVEDIVAKNIFLGPSVLEAAGQRASNPIEVTRYNRLVQVSRDHDKNRVEAFIRDLTKDGPDLRLRAAAGFDKIRFLDAQSKPLVDGHVEKIDLDASDLIFKVDSKFYRIHIGQSFEQSMRKALTDSEVKSLGLKPTPAAATPTSDADTEEN